MFVFCTKLNAKQEMCIDISNKKISKQKQYCQDLGCSFHTIDLQLLTGVFCPP